LYLVAFLMYHHILVEINSRNLMLHLHLTPHWVWPCQNAGLCLYDKIWMILPSGGKKKLCCFAVFHTSMTDQLHCLSILLYAVESTSPSAQHLNIYVFMAVRKIVKVSTVYVWVVQISFWFVWYEDTGHLKKANIRKLIEHDFLVSLFRHNSDSNSQPKVLQIERRKKKKRNTSMHK